MIKIKVPLGDKKALEAVSNMFAELAGIGVGGVKTGMRLPLPAPQGVATGTPHAETPVLQEEGGEEEGEEAPMGTPPEVDKNGLPWDERIHSSSKGMMKDGTWKYAKNIDRVTLVPQVEAELRARVSGVPSAPSAPAPYVPAPSAPAPYVPAPSAPAPSVPNQAGIISTMPEAVAFVRAAGVEFQTFVEKLKEVSIAYGYPLENLTGILAAGFPKDMIDPIVRETVRQCILN